MNGCGNFVITPQRYFCFALNQNLNTSPTLQDHQIYGTFIIYLGTFPVLKKEQEAETVEKIFRLLLVYKLQLFPVISNLK
jgi:hypothetical protein